MAAEWDLGDIIGSIGLIVMGVVLVVALLYAIATKDIPRISVECVDGYKFVVADMTTPESLAQLWENTPDGPRPAMCTPAVKKRETD